MNLQALDLGPGLNDLDWSIIFSDLPAYLTGVPLARSLVERGVTSWDDLASMVYLDLATKDRSTRGRYDPARAKLSTYMALVVSSRCLMTQRGHSRRAPPHVMAAIAAEMRTLGSMCPLPRTGASDLDGDPAQLELVSTRAQQPRPRRQRMTKSTTNDEGLQLGLFQRTP